MPLLRAWKPQQQKTEASLGGCHRPQKTSTHSACREPVRGERGRSDRTSDVRRGDRPPAPGLVLLPSRRHGLLGDERAEVEGFGREEGIPEDRLLCGGRPRLGDGIQVIPGTAQLVAY